MLARGSVGFWEFIIEINIDPLAISIGSIEIHWYGIMVALAVLVGVMVPIMMSKRGYNVGITQNEMLNIAIWSLPGGIIGARLIHVVDNWSYFSDNPSEILGGSGLGIFGAILGGTLSGIIYMKVKHIPIGRVCDIAAFGLILAQAVGRIGCIINGCCHGTTTSLPWGVMYTHPNTEAEPLARHDHVHPTHAYELLWDLMVFALIWALRKRLKVPGAIYLIYISTYSFGRFLISFMRVNEDEWIGLQQAQIVSLLVMAAAVSLLIYIHRKPTPEPE